MATKAKGGRTVGVFYGHVVLCLFGSIFFLWAATQYCAYALGYQSQLGPPWFTVGNYPVYYPWQWIIWSYHFDVYAPWIFSRAAYLTGGGVIGLFVVAFWMAIRRSKSAAVSHIYGSARWAEEKELKGHGLFEDSGVVLAQTKDAVYKPKLNSKDDSFELAWAMKKPGKHLIRHSGPEHVMCFAPTRSGKGVGLVIPTLCFWTQSAIIYDIKKELWTATAGFRRKFSNCLRFEPTAHDSVRFNPLLEIRKGKNEVKDVQNIAEVLVDPDGDSDGSDHWKMTASSLLVGSILHVLYAEPDKSLTGVANFLADPNRSIYDTLDHMLSYPHTDDGPHPVVASAAREMRNKSENELSGVVSTAMSFLGLYRDPVIARNTATSDFRIRDLQHAAHPVSLYLVIPPSDIDRTKPLVRLMLNQITKRLTEELEQSVASSGGGEKKATKHRLLLLLDEFPSLGKLGFFETQLAYLAGYKIKCFLIAQSLNQIEKAYGPNNSILDNTHVRVTYGALDDRTAKRISDLLGQTTEKRVQRNFAGSRIAPWLSNTMESEQETARALMTPGEVLQLEADTALVMIGGLPPYKAKKVMYYQDDRIKDRAWTPAPDSEAEQAAELPNQGKLNNDWEGQEQRPVEPAPVAEAVIAPQPTAESEKTPVKGDTAPLEGPKEEEQPASPAVAPEKPAEAATGFGALLAGSTTQPTGKVAHEQLSEPDTVESFTVASVSDDDDAGSSREIDNVQAAPSEPPEEGEETAPPDELDDVLSDEEAADLLADDYTDLNGGMTAGIDEFDDEELEMALEQEEALAEAEEVELAQEQLEEKERDEDRDVANRRQQDQIRQRQTGGRQLELSRNNSRGSNKGGGLPF